MIDLATTDDERFADGSRYRRPDALGTPYCITIDHHTLEDQTITIRDRDTMEQERISIDNIKNLIMNKVSITYLLKLI